MEYEPDTELRDTGQIPLLEDGGIEAFLSLDRGYPAGCLIAWQNPSARHEDGFLSRGERILIDGQGDFTLEGIEAPLPPGEGFGVRARTHIGPPAGRSLDSGPSPGGRGESAGRPPHPRTA